MELNQNTLCSQRLLIGCNRNASGLVDDIKLKLLMCVEGDVDKTKVAMRILLLMLLQLLLLRKLRV